MTITFISGDTHFPREIGASPRCNNLRNKGENKRNSQLNDECQEISSNTFDLKQRRLMSTKETWNVNSWTIADEQIFKTLTIISAENKKDAKVFFAQYDPARKQAID